MQPDTCVPGWYLIDLMIPDVKQHIPKYISCVQKYGYRMVRIRAAVLGSLGKDPESSSCSEFSQASGDCSRNICSFGKGG